MFRPSDEPSNLDIVKMVTLNLYFVKMVALNLYVVKIIFVFGQERLYEQDTGDVLFSGNLWEEFELY